jgi:hypothetical protein
VSKVITSPIKRWPGEVVISDPLTFPQIIALDDAFAAVREHDTLTVDRTDALILPGVLRCVEEFRLAGFPPNPTYETFPATPRIASAQLIAWLINEIMKLYKDAELPNE